MRSSDADGGSWFDRFVVADWSAASTPTRGRDSIWIAAVADDGDRLRVVNPPTRPEALEELECLLADGGRTLVGVDFSLGYPAGTAAALGLGGVPWLATWELLTATIVDGPRNANNRFPVASDLNRRIARSAGRAHGPFWGCPPSQSTSWLPARKPAAPALPEWRHAELALRARGRRPFSCWQLLGVGAVGSQSLVGIPAMSRLRERLTAADVVVEIWPFTTGLVAPTVAPGGVVIAEVWPSMHVGPAPDGAIRDEHQVVGTAAALAARQREGSLASLFAPDVDPAVADVVVAEEGWTLGA